MKNKRGLVRIYGKEENIEGGEALRGSAVI